MSQAKHTHWNDCIWLLVCLLCLSVGRQRGKCKPVSM